ncbi:MAG TPA: dTDP-4-dehydrorhamnose 3,5-epimerase [Spirochaetia bacterium]|nr:dTDP-4-dehydrorhamnose 3,5-epimerase [Spirochaetia bacterium]
MPFEITKAALEGMLIIRPRLFHDERGFFSELYKWSDFTAAGISQPFLQENLSRSSRGVLRGLHYQSPPHEQGKLVRVLAGRVWDVAVDIRPGSATFGNWAAVELDSESYLSVYIPPGFAHGFLTLSESADFFYACTAEYCRESEAGIRWDDPTLGIRWPLSEVVVSDKDSALPRLLDISELDSAGSQ